MNQAWTATQPNGIKNYAPTRPPSLFSALSEFDLWPTDPKVDRFMPLPISIKIDPLIFKRLTLR